MGPRKILQELNVCLKKAMHQGLGKQGLVFPIDMSAIDDEDLEEVCSRLEATFNMINESYFYSERLAQGDLKAQTSSNNIFAMPLKGLQASLAHLTWQAKQITKGDLNQKVAFMGEFSESFNQMISFLREKKIIETRLKLITDVLGEGVFLVDSEGKIIFMNPEAIHLLGYSFEEVQGLRIHEVIFKQQPDGTLYGPGDNPLFVAITSGNDYNSDDSVLTCKSGLLMPVSITCRSVFKDNILDGAVMAFRDITEQKKSEEEKILNEKLQGVLEMAGAICHEINQPLMVLSGYAEMMQQDLLNGKSEKKTEKEYITQILAQIDRIGSITSKLMNITNYQTKQYLNGQIIDIDKSSE